MQAGTLNFADGAWFAGAVNVQNGAKLNADNAVIDSLSNAGTVSVDAGKVLSVDTSVINAGVCRSNLSSAADYNWMRDKGYTAGDPGAALTTEGLDLDP